MLQGLLLAACCMPFAEAGLLLLAGALFVVAAADATATMHSPLTHPNHRWLQRAFPCPTTRQPHNLQNASHDCACDAKGLLYVKTDAQPKSKQLAGGFTLQCRHRCPNNCSLVLLLSFSQRKWCVSKLGLCQRHVPKPRRTDARSGTMRGQSPHCSCCTNAPMHAPPSSPSSLDPAAMYQDTITHS